MKQENKANARKDPFEALDAMMPPDKPTMPISELEWKAKTSKFKL